MGIVVTSLPSVAVTSPQSTALGPTSTKVRTPDRCSCSMISLKCTGEVIWRQRVGGTYYGSPVCVNNRLYCIARDGQVVVLAAAEKYELLARVPLGEPSYATPAVADGVMYLRAGSHLFSLGGKAP